MTLPQEKASIEYFMPGRYGWTVKEVRETTIRRKILQVAISFFFFKIDTDLFRWENDKLITPKLIFLLSSDLNDYVSNPMYGFYDVLITVNKLSDNEYYLDIREIIFHK